MASGISSSLKMFFGSEIPKLETLCLSENTNPDTFGKEIGNKIKDVRLKMIPKMNQASLGIKALGYDILDTNAAQRKISKIESGIQDINIEELNIELIDEVNPFQRAYEVLSKDIDAPTLKFIQDYISSNKYEFTEKQLVQAFNQSKIFEAENGRNPDKNSKDEGERYLAFALIKLREIKLERERNANDNGLR